MSQGGNSGDDRKWLALGWVLKAEIVVFAEALDVGCEREELSKQTRTWDQSN